MGHTLGVVDAEVLLPRMKPEEPVGHGRPRKPESSDAELVHHFSCAYAFMNFFLERGQLIESVALFRGKGAFEV